MTAKLASKAVVEHIRHEDSRSLLHLAHFHAHPRAEHGHAASSHPHERGYVAAVLSVDLGGPGVDEDEVGLASRPRFRGDDDHVLREGAAGPDAAGNPIDGVLPGHADLVRLQIRIIVLVIFRLHHK